MPETKQTYEIGDGLELLDDLPKDYATLIILDLPYYDVIDDEWDNEWQSLEDYIDWCKEWFIKSERVLKENGSLYYFNSQYQVLNAIDYMVLSTTFFRHRQHITIDKGWQSACSYHGVHEGIRSYPTGTEFCNWYTFQEITQGRCDVFNSIRTYFLSEKAEAGLTTCKQINRILGTSSNGGGMAAHYFNLDNKLWELPTKEQYLKLQSTGHFNREYNDLKSEYERLNNEYEKLRYPFNYQNNSYDVWHFDFYKEKRHGHPTQKPFELIERIVLTSSNEGDVVIDPAMGTGTTLKVCRAHNRNFIGRELNPKYNSDIQKRAMPSTPTLQSYVSSGGVP